MISLILMNVNNKLSRCLLWLIIIYVLQKMCISEFLLFIVCLQDGITGNCFFHYVEVKLEYMLSRQNTMLLFKKRLGSFIITYIHNKKHINLIKEFNLIHHSLFFLVIVLHY